MEADVSDAMAGLQLQQQNSENLLARKQAQGQAQQQQQYRHSQHPQPNNHTYHQQTPPQARMMQREPLQAPMPQRPQQQPPPVASVQNPVPVPAAPQHTTWQEGMPILFGGQAGASAKANGMSLPPPPSQPVDGRWDPAQGVRFVSR